MQATFTPQLLIKHLYNETTATEGSAVFSALEENEAVQEEFAQLLEAKQALDDAGGDDPGRACIRNILRYSGAQQLETA